MNLFVGLVHHPVTDRRGRVVTSAITSLDIHDLARCSRTFGVRAAYVMHPVAELREFALRVRDHWMKGPGRQHDSRRREALDLIKVVSGLDDAIADVESLAGSRPELIYTSARASNGISYESMRERLDEGRPALLLFGTGFGLAPEIIERADLALTPIYGVGTYNHLPVRAAIAIILDRLCGRRSAHA